MLADVEAKASPVGFGGGERPRSAVVDTGAAAVIDEYVELFDALVRNQVSTGAERSQRSVPTPVVIS